MSDKKPNQKALYEEEMKSQAKYNAVTNSTRVENQNQSYNIRKEALGPNGKR